jgi:hypothetical protein
MNMYIYICTHTHTRRHTHIVIHTHTHTHTHTHINIHIHIHTYILRSGISPPRYTVQNLKRCAKALFQRELPSYASKAILSVTIQPYGTQCFTESRKPPPPPPPPPLSPHKPPFTHTLTNPHSHILTGHPDPPLYTYTHTPGSTAPTNGHFLEGVPLIWYVTLYSGFIGRHHTLVLHTRVRVASGQNSEKVPFVTKISEISHL